MPINSKQFDSGTEPQTRERITKKPEIFDYLKKNKKEAFTQGEIAKEFDMNSPAARGVLLSLQKDGVVDRKECDVKDAKNNVVKRIFYLYVKDYPKEK